MARRPCPPYKVLLNLAMQQLKVTSGGEGTVGLISPSQKLGLLSPQTYCHMILVSISGLFRLGIFFFFFFFLMVGSSPNTAPSHGILVVGASLDTACSLGILMVVGPYHPSFVQFGAVIRSMYVYFVGPH